MEVKTDKTWNNLKVEQYTDTTTGVIEIRLPNQLGPNKGRLLATGDAKGKWNVNDANDFRKQYNSERKKLGEQPLSAEEFNKAFYTDGANQFNNDRANVLNTQSNYGSDAEYKQLATQHAENGIPKVTNPTTGETNNSQGQPTNSTATNLPTLEDAKKDLNQLLSDLGDSIVELPVNHTTATLRYPLGHIPNLGYDFVMFKAYEYDPTPAGGNGLLESGRGAPRETVVLPIIPNIQESQLTNWGRDEMTFLQEAAGAVASSFLTRAANSKTPGAFVQGLGESFSDTSKIAGQLVKNPELKNFLIGHFAGQASGTNVLARGQGVVINPNLELLFSGPSLRTFSFNFKLRPRDKDEGEVCKTIIRSFKKNMNPRRTAGNMFLKTPSIFEIEYVFNGAPHPSMNRIKLCALTNLSVGYTPDNNYMTYQDGTVTGFDISLGFSEINPIYADDQDKPEALTGVGY